MSGLADTGEWAANASANWPMVPGYEILAELGRGGMGVVYQARQKSLHRLIALKMIRDGALGGPSERSRFRVEAQAAGRMKHDNIVPIYEIGEHEGRPYFAMEYAEGGSLDKQIKGQPQVANRAAEMIRVLALAIQHAHENKIVHRDLKPANVLLARLAGAEALVPKITDFGLAKRLDSESTALTREGAIVGTASYMAPEQAAGGTSLIGPAADVYSLGGILYELLTGKAAFRGQTWEQTIQQVLHDEPVPPSRLCSELPRDLETICLKCLEKEPNRRYASALDLAADLDRFLGGQSVVAVPISSSERVARRALRDGYQIVREIGRGPRSIVFQAHQGSLSRPVALKVFSEGICTQEDWEGRLARAAEVSAGLAHPHILPIERAGWWDGCPYIILEYVPQHCLAGKLAVENYPLRQALRLVEQLAETVSYLHRQGATHGNLKPSNVLLAADGIPRLSDFRVSGGLFQSSLQVNGPDPAGLGYLPPEFVQNPSAEARPYTDIYGLGLILYELLAGRPAFAGSKAEEVLEQVRNEPPAAPSRFKKSITKPLDDLCLRCLDKNPWRRLSRAYELATSLRRMIEELQGGSLTTQKQRRSRQTRD